LYKSPKPWLSLRAQGLLSYKSQKSPEAEDVVPQGYNILLSDKSKVFNGGNVSFNGGAMNAPGSRVELRGLSLAGTIGFNNVSELQKWDAPFAVTRTNASYFL
jgi:hypothetical protein